MLTKFIFRNFKSFRDDTVLDLSASKITEYAEHLYDTGVEKVLPIVAIYGANASGKSNIYQAFEYMSQYVVNSFKFGGDDDSSQKSEFDYMKPTPFLFDTKSKNQESSFEVYFIDTSNESAKSYQYGFAVNSQGVIREWLNRKAKTARTYKRIFYRDTETLDLTGISAKYRENIEVSLEREVLISSLGAKLKIPKLKFIRDWFLQNEFADFGDPAESFFMSRFLPVGFVDNKEVQNNVVKFFSAFDDSIKGFHIEKISSSDSDNSEEHYTIDTIHSMIDSNETASIPLRFESDGTLKMFALYPALQMVLERGSILFVDELNARLHPLLVRNFIHTFLNSELNPRKAQLVFTTHDTWQLSSDILRRDEIYFTQKDKQGISHLYSLSDCVDEDGVKIRKDENFEKNYLSGKYKAIPCIQDFRFTEPHNNQ